MESESESESEQSSSTEQYLEEPFKGNICIKLSDGIQIPLIGWSSYQEDRNKMENDIEEALTMGHRYICSDYTVNEDILGQVLDKWFVEHKLKRDHLFISAKLPFIGSTPEKLEHFLQKSLRNLQLDYVDLYILSSPVGFTYVDDATLFPFTNNQVYLDRHTDLKAIWKAMELLVDAGLTKSLGVANFNAKQLNVLIKNARFPPTVLEVECHAYFQQNELRKVCNKHEIAMASFLPFGFKGSEGIFAMIPDSADFSDRHKDAGISYPAKDPTVLKLGMRHKTSPERILVRFLVQNGIIVTLPPTGLNYEEILDFELSEDEMNSIAKLDKGRQGRTFDFARIFTGFDTHPENPFNEPF